MKKVVVMLCVLVANVANANLPDYVQEVSVRFQPATCGQNAPEIPRRFVPPAPGYDTALVEWDMITTQALDVTSLSTFSTNLVTSTSINYTMQARFPIFNGGNGNWISRGWNENPMVLSVAVPPLGHVSQSVSHSYSMEDEVGGIDQMVFNGNTVYLKCLGTTQNQLQMTGSNSAAMDIDGRFARLKITWIDLF